MTVEYHIIDENGNKVKKTMNLDNLKDMLTNKSANKKEVRHK